MTTLRMGRIGLFSPESPNYVSGIVFMFDEMRLARIEFTLIEKRWHYFSKMREND